jgi:hypothetical protein
MLKTDRTRQGLMLAGRKLAVKEKAGPINSDRLEDN